MRQFDTDTDLPGILPEIRFSGNNHKPCLIVAADKLLIQNLQSEMFRRIPAGDRSFLRIPALSHHLRGHRRIQNRLLLPLWMFLKVCFRLCQSLRMGIDLGQLLYPAPRNSHQHMSHRNNLLPDNIIGIFHQKVINVKHASRCGIFDGKYRIIRFSLADRLHRILPGFHVEAVHFIAEERFHRRKTVGALHSLKHYRGACGRKLVDRNITVFRHSSGLPVLREQLILAFPADGHDLLEEFLHGFSVKRIGSHRSQGFQLADLPLPVENRFVCSYFVLRDFSCQTHPLFKQTDNLLVCRIDLLSYFT